MIGILNNHAIIFQLANQSRHSRGALSPSLIYEIGNASSVRNLFRSTGSNLL